MNVDQLGKTKRWSCKSYTNWVGKNLACAECGIKDDTIVAHHLRGAETGLAGGMGIKADDFLVEPLCYVCHNHLHVGNDDRADVMRQSQARKILETLQLAFRSGIITFNDRKPVHSHRLFGEDLDD